MGELFDEYGGAILSAFSAVLIITIAMAIMSGGEFATLFNNAINYYY